MPCSQAAQSALMSGWLCVIDVAQIIVKLSGEGHYHSQVDTLLPVLVTQKVELCAYAQYTFTGIHEAYAAGAARLRLSGNTQ